MAEMRVSYIVSAYRCAEFIKARIENLMDTWEFTQGGAEIVVVNASPSDDEHQIILPFIKFGVVYIRTKREPIYVSWNRGIKIAQGRYIMNANADDRIFAETPSRMADLLDRDESVGVVYTDMVATKTPNPTREEFEPSDNPYYPPGHGWPDFDPMFMLQQCYTGPFPMWRRALHVQYGLFDEGYQLAGDYEFFLRLAAHGVQFKHMSISGGLYYDAGASIRNQDLTAAESRRAILQWSEKILEQSNHS